jgi:hypothetical protein
VAGGEVIAVPAWICQLPVRDGWLMGVGVAPTVQPSRKASGNRNAKSLTFFMASILRPTGADGEFIFGSFERRFSFEE